MPFRSQTLLLPPVEFLSFCATSRQPAGDAPSNKTAGAPDVGQGYPGPAPEGTAKPARTSEPEPVGDILQMDRCIIQQPPTALKEADCGDQFAADQTAFPHAQPSGVLLHTRVARR